MNTQYANLHRLYSGCSQLPQDDVKRLFDGLQSVLSVGQSFQQQLTALGDAVCDVADLELLTDEQRSAITDFDLRVDSFGLGDYRLNDKWFSEGHPAPGVQTVWNIPLPSSVFANSLLRRRKPAGTADRTQTVAVGLSTTIIGTPAHGILLPPQTGDTLGRCQLGKELGRGGFSVVYQAQHMKLGIPVAVKVLLPDVQRGQQELDPILSEARLLAQISHPNVVRVFDVEDEGAFPYLVMEFIEGGSLEDRLKQGVIPAADVALIASQTAAGLSGALRYGVIHRDIKPANILFGSDGQVKVVDFGLGMSTMGEVGANTLTQRKMVGTVLYMSPEVVKCEPRVDHRSDIYSLGATCYHLLAGEPPFTGDTTFDVAIKHAHEQPRPLASVLETNKIVVPAGRLCDVIMRMLEKDPAARHQTYDELIADLRECSDTAQRVIDTPAPKRSLLGSLFNRQSSKPRGR